MPFGPVMARMPESVRIPHKARGSMGKASKASCKDCYFRGAGLCALPGDTPCPTFRLAKAALAPPRAAFATA